MKIFNLISFISTLAAAIASNGETMVDVDGQVIRPKHLGFESGDIYAGLLNGYRKHLSYKSGDIFEVITKSSPAQTGSKRHDANAQPGFGKGKAALFRLDDIIQTSRQANQQISAWTDAVSTYCKKRGQLCIDRWRQVFGSNGRRELEITKAKYDMVKELKQQADGVFKESKRKPNFAETPTDVSEIEMTKKIINASGPSIVPSPTPEKTHNKNNEVKSLPKENADISLNEEGRMPVTGKISIASDNQPGPVVIEEQADRAIKVTKEEAKPILGLQQEDINAGLQGKETSTVNVQGNAVAKQTAFEQGQSEEMKDAGAQAELISPIGSQQGYDSTGKKFYHERQRKFVEVETPLTHVDVAKKPTYNVELLNELDNMVKDPVTKQTNKQCLADNGTNKPCKILKMRNMGQKMKLAFKRAYQKFINFLQRLFKRKDRESPFFEKNAQ